MGPLGSQIYNINGPQVGPQIHRISVDQVNVLLYKINFQITATYFFLIAKMTSIQFSFLMKLITSNNSSHSCAADSSASNLKSKERKDKNTLQFLAELQKTHEHLLKKNMSII